MFSKLKQLTQKVTLKRINDKIQKKRTVHLVGPVDTISDVIQVTDTHLLQLRDLNGRAVVVSIKKQNKNDLPEIYLVTEEMCPMVQ